MQEEHDETNGPVDDAPTSPSDAPTSPSEEAAPSGSAIASDAATPEGDDDGDDDDDDSEGEDVECTAYDKTFIFDRWSTRFSRIAQTMQDVDQNQRWDVYVYPEGKPDRAPGVYIDLAVSGAHSFGLGWYRDVQFKLEILNHLPDGESKTYADKKRFTKQALMWGLPLVQRDDISVESGLLDASGALHLRIRVHVLREKGCSAAYQGGWDSHSLTGCVGIKNQGATCYMNSLLQALFNVDALRAAVYRMPTEHDEVSRSIPLALQRLFFRMQFGKSPASTKELTASFGWNSTEAFEQHDVQEFNRILCDKLEEKMKGTVVEGTIERLFRGTYESYLSCINVDHKSARKEHFYDVSVVVKGCATLEDSLAKYVESEVLDGDNKWKTDDHGLQDARKGIWFRELPPVLFLQLKRFDFDMRTLRNYKVNDRHEFGEKLDMKPYMDPDVVREAGPNFDAKCRYQLHGVLVHSGGTTGGHYYAYFRPTTKKRWFKFNDSRVTRATTEEAIVDNWGGSEKVRYGYSHQSISREKFANAYMLVYIRCEDVPRLLAPVRKEDIPAHLTQRFDEEEAERERRRKEKAEAHLYTEVVVVSDADLAQHTDVDLMDWERVEPEQCFRVLLTSSLHDLLPALSSQFNVPAERMRFWPFTLRENGTIRPSRTLSEAKMGDPWSKMKQARNGKKRVNLLLEASEREAEPYFDPIDSRSTLYFKFYDPVRQALEFVLRKQVNKADQVGSFAEELRAVKKLAPDTPLLFFEEVKFKPPRIDVVDPNAALDSLEIGNGDIIVFQVDPEHLLTQALESSSRGLRESSVGVQQGELRLPTADAYYAWLAARFIVFFKPLKGHTTATSVRLQLLLTNTWDEVANELAAKLNLQGAEEAEGEDVKGDDVVVQPDHLRFTKHTIISRKPAWDGPVAKRPETTLRDLVRNRTYYGKDKLANIVYYEVLPCTLEEMASKVQLEVKFQSRDGKSTWRENVLVPRDGTLADVRAEVTRLAPLDQDDDTLAPTVRLFTVYSFKIHGTVADDAAVKRYADSHQRLVAEQVAKEDEEEGAQLIRCVHVEGGTYLRSFGQPFMHSMRADTTVGAFKAAIKARLGVSDDEWAKWKFHRMLYSRATPLEDDELMSDQEWNDEHATAHFAMEHVNRRTPYQRRERALVIKEQDAKKAE